ncbi:MAG: arabinosyltransferase [Mycobacteriaceae bacterium]|nr:arabinosyltransferase [Mycobacteriaceae bacterium]
MSTAVLEAPPEPVEPVAASAPGFRRARAVAILAGVLGALFALATPFLPVEQTTAAINWPQQGALRSVNAPLMAQVPVSLNAAIPCGLVSQLPKDGGVLLATAPPDGRYAPVQSMAVRATDTTVDVMDRAVVVASAPRAMVAANPSCAIEITSNNQSTHVLFRGLQQGGKPIEGALSGDLRPQVVGVFTDLAGAAPAGLALHVDVDTRFTSHPTWMKLTAMLAAGLCTVLALLALARLDGVDGRAHRRVLPGHWFKLTRIDLVVFGVLGLWHFAGANTSDDGYILTMARTASHAGYMANYFRWYGVPEAPFGWYYSVVDALAKVSTASPWVRLPALIAGLLCWMVISREVAPRLGRAVRNNRVALWTGALVFLAFWLPYNNGLRPEPIVALGVLLTWCSVERAIATGRLLPAAVGCIVGAFTLAAAPTGLNCVVVLIVAARPLVRIIVRRRRQLSGPRRSRLGSIGNAVALTAPIAAGGLLVLTVVYGNQTFAGIQEADRVRQIIGPNLKWYEDYLRYYWLFVQTVDGSLSRRFAFLVMLLCLFTMLLMMLRRRRIPGVAAGPTWRLMGVVFGTIFLMMFNPTKWTHHFGAYAGIAGGLATVTAVVVSERTLRSRRNRTIFLAGLLFVLALTFSGVNGYWYVSSYGVPWFDKTVSLKGYQSNTFFLGLFGLAMLLLAWQYLREGYTSSDAGGRWNRLRRFTIAPLTAAAALMVAFEVISLVKGATSQYPAYSLARSNFQALTGNHCGLANDVLVEPNPNLGLLQPYAEPGHRPKNPRDALAGENPVNFDPNGIPTDVSADELYVPPGTGNTSNSGVAPAFVKGQSAGTSGGTAETKGINGSTAKLPFGLDPHITPVLGSYQATNPQPASVTSSWYRLPARSSDSPLIVISAAGRLQSVDSQGNTRIGQTLLLEYGKQTADGAVRVEGNFLPKDIGPTPAWRNLRVPVAGIAPDADMVRIVAFAPYLQTKQWMAFTPPRVPKLQTLNSFLGSTQPILEDWAVGLQFPCQRPVEHRDGVAQAPNYRIKPDRVLAVSSTDTWQAQEFGGINGWADMLSESVTVPTYLKDNWDRDWGSLEKYKPYYPNAVAAQIDTGSATRSGLWSPGKMRIG